MADVENVRWSKLRVRAPYRSVKSGAKLPQPDRKSTENNQAWLSFKVFISCSLASIDVWP